MEALPSRFIGRECSTEAEGVVFLFDSTFGRLVTLAPSTVSSPSLGRPDEQPASP
jgi:hypothetical protein